MKRDTGYTHPHLTLGYSKISWGLYQSSMYRQIQVGILLYLVKMGFQDKLFLNRSL